MAAVTVNYKFDEGVMPWLEVARVTVTTTGDTYTSRFKNVNSVLVSDRTTIGGARASTVSGGTITITCTGGDVVDLWIVGDTN